MKEEKKALEFKSLNGRIHYVMGEVERVAKSSRNTEQRYDYASAEDFINACREAMHEAGLIVGGIKVKQAEHVPFQTSKGTPMTRAAYVIIYTLTDIENSGSRDYEVPCEGTDTMDKASYKAMTGGYKYFLRMAFMIGMSDDPEATHEEPPAPAYNPPARKPAPAPAAKPAPVKAAPAPSADLPQIYELVKNIKKEWAGLIANNWAPSAPAAESYRAIMLEPEKFTVKKLTDFLNKLQTVI
jgi:hypothetical protein